MTNAFCGIDWAEDHHDVAIIDNDGNELAYARIANDAVGLAELYALLAEHDCGDMLVPIAIETSRGLLVACLRATHPVFPINPLAVARYRDRHSVAKRKSDRGDAVVLANILRTDRHLHRQLPNDTDDARAVAVLARAQQDAAWDRIDTFNALRNQLLEFFPIFLNAFAHQRGGVMRPEARLILATAPTPELAAKLTLTQLRALLKRAGRVRNIDQHASRLQRAFRSEQLRHAAPVEAAMGRHTVALLRRLDTACQNVDDLAAATVEAFNDHADAKIITSFPGVGPLVGARLLAEIGDDRARFIDARGLKSYAGSAPITRASGKSRSVATRRIKNQRLAAAGYHWAFSALTASPGARAHYERRRQRGDAHIAAQRNLYNRLLGCLFHCLQQQRHYDETIAFPLPEKQAA